ncbi:hypothetical protein LBMAG42_24290 [Deltaproteobacteria bacterium]|nr:hypothetical protein LBMAG42_24290 [Deltaproteobacteria bacterium]
MCAAPILAFALSFAPGCAPGAEPADTAPADPTPIVVFWSLDTLGQRAALDDGMCARLGAVAATHAAELACLEGGVSPSSWTVESHARLWWPALNVGARRADLYPACDDPSVLARAAGALGGSLFLGLDNPRFADPFADTRCDGASPWATGVTEAWIPDFTTDLATMAAVPEAERPWSQALDALGAAAAAGGPAFAYLNDLDVGGHVPRCVGDPEGAECQLVWRYALAAGIVVDSDDPAVTMATTPFWSSVHDAVQLDHDSAASDLRAMVYGTILAQVEWFRVSRVEDRLERLFSTLETAGRLDDLTLVMLGDHGEAPCAEEPISKVRACGHGDLPNEWNAQVPVFVYPASTGQRWAASGFVGNATTPWATANLAQLAANDLGLPAPEEWPVAIPAGRATSWACSRSMLLGFSWGVDIKGDRSVRCDHERCGEFDWHALADLSDGPMLATDLPASLTAREEGTAGQPNWFMAACAGLVPD